MTSPGVEECALRARSTHGVHHAIVEVNIVIGAVLGELHVVVRVHIPLVCDDALVRLTIVLIALVVIVVFVVASFREFCCMEDVLFTPSGPCASASTSFLDLQVSTICSLCGTSSGTSAPTLVADLSQLSH